MRQFTELNVCCTLLCAFSRQGQHNLFRQCSHNWLYQRVLTLWPSCPLCPHFSGSSHPQMHSKTLIISPVTHPFISLFVSHVLPSSFLSKCFACLCFYSNSVKRDTWRGRWNMSLLYPCFYSLLFRRPTPEVCLIPAGSVNAGTNHPQGSWISLRGRSGFRGGGWGSDGVGE